MSGPQLGMQGTITIASRGADGPGEVELTHPGGSETFIAHSSEPLPRGAAVVVIELRGGRRVDVAPLR